MIIKVNNNVSYLIWLPAGIGTFLSAYDKLTTMCIMPNKLESACLLYLGTAIKLNSFSGKYHSKMLLSDFVEFILNSSFCRSKIEPPLYTDLSEPSWSKCVKMSHGTCTCI